jgi:16S rRNA (cytosine1402-N4)-methyltransferase
VTSTAAHVPVLLDESLRMLRVVPGGCYCDVTLGAGGHAREILTHSAPDGRLLGIDRDPHAVQYCTDALAEFGSRVTLRQGNFRDLPAIIEDLGWGAADGVMADLGISSRQLADAERGFSFAEDGPLDMRMTPGVVPSALALIGKISEFELAALLRDYGEERHHKRIARAIKRAHREKRLNGTADLRDIVVRAARPPKGTWRIHPATRTFQALRIAVNDELGALSTLVDRALDVVRPGGTLVIISFHSLEDRIVKHGFNELARPSHADSTTQPPMVSVLTRKPIRPSDAEVGGNPRARSARLRAAERLR